MTYLLKERRKEVIELVIKKECNCGEKINRFGIEKLVNIEVSVINEKEEGLYSDQIRFNKDAEWLNLVQKIEMKNKTVYVYEVL